MPERRIHNAVCKTLLNDDCDKVNRALDYPVRSLGTRHRQVFHSVPEALFLGALFDKNPIKGMMAGALHLLLDFRMSQKVRKSGRK